MKKVIAGEKAFISGIYRCYECGNEEKFSVDDIIPLCSRCQHSDFVLILKKD